MKTFFELTKSTAKEMVRDRMSMFWFLAFPVLFILLFGTIFSSESDNQTFNIGLVIEEKGGLGEAVTLAFQEVPAFKLHEEGKENELKALQEGKRTLVIIVPGNLPGVNSLPGKLDVNVYYDAGRQGTNQVLIPVVNQVLTEVERKLTNRPKLFEVKSQPVQAKRLRNVDYFLPSILAMALMQLGLFGSLRLVSLRERKILRNLGATPLNRSILFASEVVVRLAMSIIQTAILVIIGYLVFDVTITGNWLVVAGIVLLGSAAFVSMGYMLASFSKTEESGQGLIQLVQFPMMFLSGTFFPVEVMPDFLRPVIKAIPLTYLGDALRQVMVGFAPAYDLFTDVLVLAAWLIVTTILATRLWKWE